MTRTAESREAPAAMTPPVMTVNHVAAIMNGVEDATPESATQLLLLEISTLVRSQVSGDSVSVPTAEIEAVQRVICEQLSERFEEDVPKGSFNLYDDPYTVTMQAYKFIRGWLSSSLPSAGTKR